MLKKNLTSVNALLGLLVALSTLATSNPARAEMLLNCQAVEANDYGLTGVSVQYRPSQSEGRGEVIVDTRFDNQDHRLQVRKDIKEDSLNEGLNNGLVVRAAVMRAPGSEHWGTSVFSYNPSLNGSEKNARLFWEKAGRINGLHPNKRVMGIETVDLLCQ